MAVLEAILNRRSVREYSQKAVLDPAIEEVVKAAQFAPTAHDNRAVQFVVVRDKGTREKLFELLGSDQDFVRDAPALIAPVTVDSPLAVQDLSVASQSIFIQAASLGLGTVWKNISPENAQKVKSILGIPAKLVLVNLIPIGYPKSRPEPHSDAGFDKKKIHFEKW